MLLPSILPVYLGCAHAAIFQVLFGLSRASHPKQKEAKQMMVLYDKLAGPLLYLQCVMVALMYYSAFEGVYSPFSAIFALLNTPLLLINAYGNFKGSVYHGYFRALAQSQPINHTDYRLTMLSDGVSKLYLICVGAAVLCITAITFIDPFVENRRHSPLNGQP